MEAMMKRIPGFGAFLIFPAVFALLCACPQPGPPEDPYKDLPSKIFSAIDYTSSKYYRLEAVKLAEREGSVVVYGERSARVSLEDAETIADEFADHILPLISSIFGAPLDYNEDGMITLLLLDIKDGMNGSFTAGYFDFKDMSLNSGLNEMDMLYLDIVQGGLKRDDFFATIAHELQHLIRYSAYLKGKPAAYPDTWLNEGLSLAAEYIYSNEREKTAGLNDDYVKSFNGKDRESRISEGNNFFVWMSDDYTLDEYATAYFFFQWLRIQANNDIGIYGDIIAAINSGKGGYEAVLEAAEARIDPGLNSWEALIRSWLLANYVKADQGLYGYAGKFPSLTTIASSKESLNFYSGEGAYSKFREGQSFSPSGQSGAHLKYVGVTEDGMLSNTGSVYTGDRLLTFNSNSDSNNSRPRGERGWLTGLGDPPVSGRTSRQSSGDYLPYRVDALPALSDPGRSPGEVPGQ
jgi:hypothetical protein